ncbi:MAG: putative transporter [Tidjanibacter sp.]|nr:putative transporter [Tidjanibacter sp.]
MEWLSDLIFGSGVAHNIFIIAITIAVGILLSKFKIKGVSIGITWILFVGIALSHFGMLIDDTTLHFAKEFGLILFIYSVGIQVGPSFFSSFKRGGVKLNIWASAIVLLGVVTTYAIHIITGTDLTTMVGVLSGAVTNTPGLGAAQQAYTDTVGITDPTIALGYAVAYPLGVIGLIMAMIVMKAIFRVDYDKENKRLEEENVINTHTTDSISVKVNNPQIIGRKVVDVRRLINRSFVISRIMHSNGEVILADGQSIISEGDIIYIVSPTADTEAVVAYIGTEIEMDNATWKEKSTELVSRRIVITRPEISGKQIGALKLRTNFGVNVTRVNRAGIDLLATPNLELNIGDRVTVVGSEMALQDVSRMLGNSLKRLREPNLVTMFFGILLGVMFGMIPFQIGSMPQPIKLGLAGGPLIVALLLSRFGPHFKFVPYTTVSANLMLREIGISLFLAAVGLGAGEDFVEAIVNGGYKWILYGFIITVVPVMIVGFCARKWGKMDFFSVQGLMAGSMTNPLALSFASSSSPNDIPAVSYSTVYPLTMFLRVLTAQVLILMAI